MTAERPTDPKSAQQFFREWEELERLNSIAASPAPTVSPDERVKEIARSVVRDLNDGCVERWLADDSVNHAESIICDAIAALPASPAVEGELVEALTWAMCAESGGGGKGKCNPDHCACGAEARGVVKELSKAGYTLSRLSDNPAADLHRPQSDQRSVVSGAEQGAAAARALRSTNELLVACEDDFLSDDTELGEWREPDDEPVAAGSNHVSSITFGMVRDARHAFDFINNTTEGRITSGEALSNAEVIVPPRQPSNKEGGGA